MEFICLEVKATGRQRCLLLECVDEWFRIVCEGSGVVIMVLKFMFLLAPSLSVRQEGRAGLCRWLVLGDSRDEE